ncbi:MAG: hypothetical protein JRG73_19050, partial [Deltaproteobacteria bacterium]|nr:hypothetical protein [Deltaproteobacteria bacterium]
RRLPAEWRAGTLPLRAIPPMGRPLHLQYPEVIPPRSEHRGRVAFFPGCATSFVLDDIGRAVIHVLTGSGFEVILPRDPSCCGAPMFLTGEHRVSRGNIEHNISTLLQPGIEAVITCCATCGSALRREYPEMMEKLHGDVKGASVLAEKTRDVMEFIAEAGPGVASLAAVPVRTTYHHPCHLLHGQGVRDAPRRVLEQIPGLEWVEMKEGDSCCGGGGSFQLYFPETSEKIVGPKIDHILESGAQTVATGCPGCIIQIAGNLPRRAKDIDVLHPIQILARAMPE